jgi:threonine dehydrogenase-like Zn-dependent dehydrogenase
MEAHGHPAMYAYDRAKQALMLENDRPLALREAITACRNGGTVSVIGVYSGFIDKFPMGSLMNRGITLRTGSATCTATCGRCWNGSRTARSTRRS